MQVLAEVLGAEAAVGRIQFASGTHAIATALYTVLRPGNELLAVAGRHVRTFFPVLPHPAVLVRCQPFRPWHAALLHIPCNAEIRMCFRSVHRLECLAASKLRTNDGRLQPISIMLVADLGGIKHL